jgi:hypothetical protein
LAEAGQLRHHILDCLKNEYPPRQHGLIYKNGNLPAF